MQFALTTFKRLWLNILDIYTIKINKPTSNILKFSFISLYVDFNKIFLRKWDASTSKEVWL
jgi:hypothetical protein